MNKGLPKGKKSKDVLAPDSEDNRLPQPSDRTKHLPPEDNGDTRPPQSGTRKEHLLTQEDLPLESVGEKAGLPPPDNGGDDDNGDDDK